MSARAPVGAYSQPDWVISDGRSFYNSKQTRNGGQRPTLQSAPAHRLIDPLMPRPHYRPSSTLLPLPDIHAPGLPTLQVLHVPVFNRLARRDRLLIFVEEADTTRRYRMLALIKASRLQVPGRQNKFALGTARCRSAYPTNHARRSAILDVVLAALLPFSHSSSASKPSMSWAFQLFKSPTCQFLTGCTFLTWFRIFWDVLNALPTDRWTVGATVTYLIFVEQADTVATAWSD
ncbi:hypothetical protein C8R44DRAFT_734713 [Mycena epipterygia]|nr:hypothetical protein C8R44DRAFT_734713 [Mycena epipterygia]